MMKLKAKKNNKVFSLIYEDGMLSGDEFAVRLVETYADALEGKMVGPVGGPWTETNHLEDPLSALFVMRDAFDKIIEITGDIPEPPEVPQEAIV